MFLMVLAAEEKKKDNMEYRGPDCPKCKIKSHQIEFGRVVYWFCKKCKEEVKSLGWGSVEPEHSLSPCKECEGTAAHRYWCSVSVEHRKKRRRS